jgi:hypothetical protein
MSLTSHLNDTRSPIGQFLRERFSQSTGLTKEANRQLKSATAILPLSHPWPYREIGRAIDYRIRYGFALTPSRRLVAMDGALRLVTKPMESDNDIPFDWNDVPVGFGGIPVPTGENGELLEAAQGPYPFKVIVSFFDRLDATLQNVQPVGRLLEPETEKLLARYCYVLSLFEEIYRAGLRDDSPLLVPTPRASVEELLNIPEAAWIDDLCALWTLFYEKFQSMLSCQSILNPTFAGSRDVGGADADLIVEGCLIEIKTSKMPKIDLNFLRQLAGYLLLDYEDEHAIQSVGVYMARQGLFFEWPVPDFLHLLTGENTASLSQLRQEFRQLVQGRRLQLRS